MGEYREKLGHPLVSLERIVCEEASQARDAGFAAAPCRR
jgi:hypothetical protein